MLGDVIMVKPAVFLGSVLAAGGIFGVVVTMVQLTDPFYWWFIFFLLASMIGGFSLGSIRGRFREDDKNALLTVTGFMLATVILLTVYFAIWESSSAPLNAVIPGLFVILIVFGSSILTYIGTALMSV